MNEREETIGARQRIDITTGTRVHLVRRDITTRPRLDCREPDFMDQGAQATSVGVKLWGWMWTRGVKIILT